MPLIRGQILNNRYRIEELLGQGGFGAVYKAWDLNLERWRALKENLDASSEAQRQFKREAQILCDLAHPNLPRVIDYFVIPDPTGGSGSAYLVMDFVEGEDLGKMLERNHEPLPEAQVVDWLVQVCEALEYLHSQQPPVIHRDIKPANIKVTPSGKAMLVDFGIAKLLDPYLKTTVGARACTPGYSPPEQYGSGATDAQSDIYALGATAYHLLTGSLPPDSMDVVSGSAAHRSLAHELNPSISPPVSAAVERAMQLNRANRWHSVAEFKKALIPSPEVESGNGAVWEKTVAVQPISPQTPTLLLETAASAPASKERSRIGIVGLGALAFVGVVVLGLVIWGLSSLLGGGRNIPTQAPPAAIQASVKTGAPTTAALPDLGGKTITIAVENAYPPFNSIDQKANQGVGWDYDTVTEICRRLNCKAEFKQTTWDGIFPAMSAGKFDVLADGVTITDERKKHVDFSIPYVTIGQVLLVRADETLSVNQIKADQTKLIGAQIGTTNELVAKKTFPEARVKSFDDFDAAVLALLAGNIDGVVIDHLSALSYMSQNEGKMKVDGILSTNEPLGFVFPPKSELRAAFDAALDAMKADGTLDALNLKWGLAFRAQ
jgi:ABC-type amino acid transport substrate-binding protein